MSEALSIARSSVTVDPPRDHHASFVYETKSGAFLYVVGGAQDEFAVVHDDVLRAEIHQDGSLGPFAKIGTLPDTLAASGVALVGDVVVLSGGMGGKGRLPVHGHTLTARIAEDGTLGPWTAGPELPNTAMHPASAVHGDSVYVFGGTGGTVPTTMSVRARVRPDGTLSEFEKLTPLSPRRSHQAAFVHGGSVYLVGGLTEAAQGNPPSRTDVVRAEILSDGTLGPWIEAGTLPVPLSVSSAEVRGCHVYMLGGLSDGPPAMPFSDTVLRGTLAEDGSIVDIVALESRLSVKRAHVHQTPIFRDFIYSVGGRSNDRFASLATVDIGTFTPQ